MSSSPATRITAAQREAWAQSLKQVSAAPLEACEGFPRIARRFEAWWAGEALDRPILIGAANPRPERPVTRRLDLLERPEEWLAAKLLDVQQLHRVGDTLPMLRVDFGPTVLGAMLGAKVAFSSDTSWTHAFIDDDWSNEPDWAIQESDRWLHLLRVLAGLAAENAPGRYVVCTPDIGAAGDLLLNLRGAGPLSLDLLTRPDNVRRAVARIYPLWEQLFSELYEITAQHGAGLIHWLNLWSDVPYVTPACDFMVMIGPQHFEEFFLEDLARVSSAVGRACFHLDGAGGVRHLDALLSIPEMRAIQFIPSPSEPPPTAWIEMFKKVRAAGRSLLINCQASEVMALCDALGPEGVAFWLDAPASPEELDAVAAQLRRRYGAPD